jgi:hypothetical protein
MNAPASTARASPMRRGLKRWMAIGLGGSGSSFRNSACRSRPWARSIRRSCVGMVNPRVAANASLISSTLNRRSARW